MDSEEFERWWRAAQDAVKASRVSAEAGLYHWACFLAEQAAQLALKGFLHGIGSGAWGHDLVSLGQAVEKAVGEDLPKPLPAALRRLSRHYIPARYPDAHPSGPPSAHYGPEDAVQAQTDVAAILGLVQGMWSELLLKAAHED